MPISQIVTGKPSSLRMMVIGAISIAMRVPTAELNVHRPAPPSVLPFRKNGGIVA